MDVNKTQNMQSIKKNKYSMYRTD